MPPQKQKRVEVRGKDEWLVVRYNTKIYENRQLRMDEANTDYDNIGVQTKLEEQDANCKTEEKQRR